MKKHIVVLTGAGISQESGIKTFRDANGLWENHDIMEVASPQGFQANPALVLEFYNLRRAQLKEVEPNAAHKFLANLEKEHKVTIITQNVDNLHERAGSSHIVHLHGMLTQMRSVKNENVIFDIEDNIKLGDQAEDGGQLRPHIVWFGEAVPKMEEAIEITLTADIFIIIGTSLQVYPAASLVDYVPHGKKIYIIDPEPTPLSNNQYIKHIQKKAIDGCQELRDELKKIAK